MLTVVCLVAGATACFEDPTVAMEPIAAEGSTSTSAAPGLTTDPSTTTDASEDTTSAEPDGTSSEGDASADEGPVETTDAEPDREAVLYDFFANSCMAQWASTSGGAKLSPAPCDASPMQPNTVGGGWRFPMFLSPAFGGQTDVLMLRPYPTGGGYAEASFSGMVLPFEDEPVLRFAYEFVETDGSPTVGEMSFQVRRVPPGMAGPGDTYISEVLGSDGTHGEVDLPLGFAGPLDELVFIVIADTPAPGQAVALYNPRLVPGP